ncbi:toxin, beta-grasp domain protein [Staphylococcus aureus CA-347]|nr:toxin, beta-grasp domain protein [Staphylococcus aureus CA-347]
MGAEFFQFYSDNRTVSSSNYHIDVFLYKDYVIDDYQLNHEIKPLYERKMI